MTKLYFKARKTYLLLPVTSAAALALLSMSPTIQAAETTAPAAASSLPAASAPQAQPTPEQFHILHQMDPALHAGMGHPHGPPQGPHDHDCPHDCAQSAQGTPPGDHPEGKSATVNGTLSIKTPEGTRTITMSDVAHGGEAPCFWPVGGSIHLTGSDNVAHTATFAAACGHVTLDGVNLTLPTKHEDPHGGGPDGPHHKMGKQSQAKPSAG